jgi:hypothetical protein
MLQQIRILCKWVLKGEYKMSWKSLSWKIILLLIIGGILFLWFMKAPIMSWYLTEKLNVPTSISRISMRPSKTTVRGFRIKNPRGFKMKSAFEAETTTIEYRLGKLRNTPSEIDLITIDDIFLGIECSNPLCSKNNWTAIGNGMVQKQEKERPHQVVVHKIVLTNMNVEVRGLGIGKPPMYKQIDYLEFNEVSSEKGFPTDKLIRAIFQGAGIQDYIKDMLNPQDTIKKLLPGGLFGENEKGP